MKISITQNSIEYQKAREQNSLVLVKIIYVIARDTDHDLAVVFLRAHNDAVSGVVLMILTILIVLFKERRRGNFRVSVVLANDLVKLHIAVAARH